MRDEGASSSSRSRPHSGERPATYKQNALPAYRFGHRVRRDEEAEEDDEEAEDEDEVKHEDELEDEGEERTVFQLELAFSGVSAHFGSVTLYPL